MDLLRIAAIAAVIIFVVARRLRGQPMQPRRLLVLPAVLAAIGALDLLRNAGGLHPADVLLLGINAAVALGLGAARGATIEVFAREGRPWQRYRATTVLIWVLLIGARFGLGLLAHTMNAPAAEGTTSLLLMLGLSLLAEGLVVAPRARALGLPFSMG